MGNKERMKRDVDNMMTRISKKFYRPCTCNHTVHEKYCTIKKNGDCEVCGLNLDMIRRYERIGFNLNSAH